MTFLLGAAVVLPLGAAVMFLLGAAVVPQSIRCTWTRNPVSVCIWYITITYSRLGKNLSRNFRAWHKLNYHTVSYRIYVHCNIALKKAKAWQLSTL